MINDLDGSPQVLRNETAGVGNWLLVALEGLAPNTDAIGARVTVRSGARTQTRLVQSGTSYLSQSDMRLHFGLGAATVDAIEVRWPDGSGAAMRDVAANRVVRIAQAK